MQLDIYGNLPVHTILKLPEAGAIQGAITLRLIQENVHHSVHFLVSIWYQMEFMVISLIWINIRVVNIMFVFSFWQLR